MNNIRVLGRTSEGYGEGTIRIFKIGEEEKAIAFMKKWIVDGASGDTVYAIIYEDGKKKSFIKGFKKR